MVNAPLLSIANNIVVAPVRLSLIVRHLRGRSKKEPGIYIYSVGAFVNTSTVLTVNNPDNCMDRIISGISWECVYNYVRERAAIASHLCLQTNKSNYFCLLCGGLNSCSPKVALPTMIVRIVYAESARTPRYPCTRSFIEPV